MTRDETLAIFDRVVATLLNGGDFVMAMAPGKKKEKIPAPGNFDIPN